jgi:hypothetical protein
MIVDLQLSVGVKIECDPSPDKSSPEEVAAKLFILQGGAEPLSSVPVWAEPSQMLIGMWPASRIGKIPTFR